MERGQLVAMIQLGDAPELCRTRRRIGKSETREESIRRVVVSKENFSYEALSFTWTFIMRTVQVAKAPFRLCRDN